MRSVPGIACVSLTLALAATAQVPAVEHGRVAVRDLVPSGDRLAAQDLGFDASSARLALEYLRTHDSAVAIGLAESPAITHILDHARNFDYDVPKESRAALVSSLLAPRDREAERSATCRQSLAYLGETLLADPQWVGDALRYLPAGFRFHGTLFLTFGYDIGVALAPNASLNCAHPHFDGHPSELLYYAIHELHHVGFMTFQTPPRLADVKSCADLLRLVEYSTQMEGMAVLAAYQRRRDDGTLADDADYAALVDAQRMQVNLASYFKDYGYLRSRGSQPADPLAWGVIDRMSSGERLWYRVGAYLTQRIEAAKGREALVALVERGPREFMATYRSMSESPADAGRAPSHERP